MKLERASNFELLRIIAMFLVLVVHVDCYSLGMPSAEECFNTPLPSATRIIIESISIVCVNVFVLISGWFGIHFKWRSLLNYLFQVFFFGVVLYFFSILFLNTSFNLKGTLACFQLTPWNWFVKSYLLLYLISPVLNAFCEKASQKEFLTVLSGFFIFQSIYGWSGSAKFIMQGGSTMSFIGLYLLAQYFRNFVLCKQKKYKVRAYSFLGYITCILLYSFFRWLVITMNLYIFMPSYVNPLVILASLAMITFCSTLNFQSRFINIVASSSFAVYLLHTNVNLFEKYFVTFVKKIYESYNGLNCLVAIFCFLIFVFVIAILLDQVRKITWKIFVDRK